MHLDFFHSMWPLGTRKRKGSALTASGAQEWQKLGAGLFGASLGSLFVDHRRCRIPPPIPPRPAHCQLYLINCVFIYIYSYTFIFTFIFFMNTPCVHLGTIKQWFVHMPLDSTGPAATSLSYHPRILPCHRVMSHAHLIGLVFYSASNLTLGCGSKVWNNEVALMWR